MCWLLHAEHEHSVCAFSICHITQLCTFVFPCVSHLHRLMVHNLDDQGLDKAFLHHCVCVSSALALPLCSLSSSLRLANLCCLCSGVSLALTLPRCSLSSLRFANLCCLCSGVSSALTLAQCSLSSSLRLANLCCLCSGVSLALTLAQCSLSSSLCLANLSSLCSGVSLALTFARRSLSSLHLANLYCLCSGISSALPLAQRSLSSSLRLANLCIILICCVGVIQNVTASDQFPRLNICCTICKCFLPNTMPTWLAHARI